MFDFGDIHKESAGHEIAYLELQKYIQEKVGYILYNLAQLNYPTKEEMEDWPDAAWKPKDKGELSRLIHYISNSFTDSDLYECSLNWIDVSEITDMNALFWFSPFNGDISRWVVNNVTDMGAMFYRSRFNGNLSRWNVGNVRDMHSMFSHSEFTGKNGDISCWNVSQVEDMSYMFALSKFNGDISQWDVSNVINYTDIFFNSKIDNIINHGIITKEKAKELGYFKFSKHV